MKHKFILKLITFAALLSITACLQCCNNKDKQIVLTDTMKEDINYEEDQILSLIDEGDSYLNSKEFDKAKECYEKAISMNITNESTYLKIKDDYINAKRYDDAYYIIKLAIDNNASKESMDNLLKDIQSYFSPTLISISAYKDSNYTLPSKITIPINEIDTDAAIRWDISEVDTSKIGTFMINGYADEYGRAVSLNLNVIEKPAKQVTNESDANIKKKDAAAKSLLSGFIEDFYYQSDTPYIVFDEIQYFDNPNEVENEYLKDYSEPSEFAYGALYYYRNTSQATKVYKLSPNVVINLCEYTLKSIDSIDSSKIPPDSSSNNTLFSVTIDNLKDYVNKNKKNDTRALMFRITLSNDTISEINMIFTP